MEHSELLRYVVGVVSDLGLRYFVTGSTATIFYGEPRFTNDIDLVVDLPEFRVIQFCNRFPTAEFYVSDIAARQAVLQKTQFNIIHPESGLKIDVIVAAENAFNESRFARSRPLRPEKSFEAMFTSPEDAIIKKIEFFQEGKSEKHVRDIAGVIKVSKEQIDMSYITEWAKKLGLDATWKAIQERIGPAIEPPRQNHAR
jgi:hypothetical protein